MDPSILPQPPEASQQPDPSAPPAMMPGMQGDMLGLPPMPPQDSSMPSEMPTPPLPEAAPVEPSPSNGELSSTDNGKNSDIKKKLLSKLMSNLMDKPSRSLHEMVNGVKDVIGAYKSFAKEIDAVSGDGILPSSPSDTSQTQRSSDIQKILQGIQSKKDLASPSPVDQGPAIPEPTPSLPPAGMGGPGYGTTSNQSTSYNRPAPVSNLGIFGY